MHLGASRVAFSGIIFAAANAQDFLSTGIGGTGIVGTGISTSIVGLPPTSDPPFPTTSRSSEVSSQVTDQISSISPPLSTGVSSDIIPPSSTDLSSTEIVSTESETTSSDVGTISPAPPISTDVSSSTISNNSTLIDVTSSSTDIPPVSSLTSEEPSSTSEPITDSSIITEPGSTTDTTEEPPSTSEVVTDGPSTTDPGPTTEPNGDTSTTTEEPVPSNTIDVDWATITPDKTTGITEATHDSEGHPILPPLCWFCPPGGNDEGFILGGIIGPGIFPPPPPGIAPPPGFSSNMPAITVDSQGDPTYESEPQTTDPTTGESESSTSSEECTSTTVTDVTYFITQITDSAGEVETSTFSTTMEATAGCSATPTTATETATGTEGPIPTINNPEPDYMLDSRDSDDALRQAASAFNSAYELASSIESQTQSGMTTITTPPPDSTTEAPPPEVTTEAPPPEITTEAPPAPSPTTIDMPDGQMILTCASSNQGWELGDARHFARLDDINADADSFRDALIANGIMLGGAGGTALYAIGLGKTVGEVEWLGGDGCEAPVEFGDESNNAAAAGRGNLDVIINMCDTASNDQEFWKGGGTLEAGCWKWSIKK